MGRLPALALSGALALGCDEVKTDPPVNPTRERSNAVVASSDPASKAAGPSPAGTTKTGPTGAAKPEGAAPAKPAVPKGPICVGQSPKPAPKGNLTAASAPGAPLLSPKLAFGVGKWVWINLWAAWCGPCKEEMPRILGWQDKLRAAGILVDLAFVSLDDDERQLHRFLESQPPGGVRASYWLAEGSGRSSWLASLGLRDTPELPVQALVSPTGDLACVIQGAVEEQDYSAILAFLNAKR